MSKIVASANDSPTRITIVWAEVQGTRIPLSKNAEVPTDLPSDQIVTIGWDFRGSPGDEALVELYEKVGQKWALFEPPLKITMPGGKGRVTSDNPPAGQEPYTIQT